MILKVSGCITILLCSSLIGYVLSRDLSRRPAELRDLQTMLYILENEISYLSNLLVDAFEKVIRSCNSNVSAFFKATIENLKSDRSLTASQAWEFAVRDNIKMTALNKEDEEILASFGKILGSSDIEGQVKNIRLTLKQLENQEKKAEEIRKKNEGMYKKLGILAGLALVVIII
ncbi:MAG: stage III sporulation protein SpoIIIAB [Acetivibrionales bacterium]|jgi:stage III sporulation protein AB